MLEMLLHSYNSLTFLYNSYINKKNLYYESSKNNFWIGHAQALKESTNKEKEANYVLISIQTDYGNKAHNIFGYAKEQEKKLSSLFTHLDFEFGKTLKKFRKKEKLERTRIIASKVLRPPIPVTSMLCWRKTI